MQRPLSIHMPTVFVPTVYNYYFYRCYFTGAISITCDPVKHELTKHIGVDTFYTRAQVQAQVIAL
jgi:hypothetical protein